MVQQQVAGFDAGQEEGATGMILVLELEMEMELWMRKHIVQLEEAQGLTAARFQGLKKVFWYLCELTHTCNNECSQEKH